MKVLFARIAKWWSQIENGLIGTLGISAVIYAITTRTAEQFLPYGLTTYAVIAAILNTLGAFFLLQNRARKPLTLRRVCRAAALMCGGAIPFSLLYYSLGVVMIDMLDFTTGQQQWSQRHMMAITAALTVIVGAGFFWFRLRQRFLYGFSEALAGIAIATHRAGLEKKPLRHLRSSKIRQPSRAAGTVRRTARTGRK